jgi:alpha-L-rhamnosidase
MKLAHKLLRIVKMRLIIVFFFLPFLVSADLLQSAQPVNVENLRCEYRENPLGIDNLKPRFSWNLSCQQRGQYQTAYQILVASSPEKLEKNSADLWDSGKITSAQNAQIFYNGKPLESDRYYYWKVKVWDKDDQSSSWSMAAFWSTGLLWESDWQAEWIGLDQPVADDDPDALNRRLCARLLRKEFMVNKKIRRATAFISGLGLFELYLNGARIGDQVLAPGLTEYDKRSFYLTFDVTKSMQAGNNAIGIILGNGRYFAPRSEKPTRTKTYGYPKLLLQLNIYFEDGSSLIVASNDQWKLYTDGPIRANSEYDGEIYDARMEIENWSKTGFDDSSWRKAEKVDKPGENIVSQITEPIKVMRTIQPVSVNEPEPGVFIFDMGQNMVGWVRLKVSGDRGTKISMKFSEVLNEKGLLYLDNIRGALVNDIYILKGNGTEFWEPKFTYHGFRYVEIRGFPGSPGLSAIEGRVVYDALEQSGSFITSNTLINNIYKNAVWGIIGNYRSIPTDCPQRDERQGWLGDRSMESKGESFIFNISNFYNKWLNDIRDAQRDNGSIPDVAPSYWPIYTDNTTWPGSYIIIPAMLYDQYGDLQTIKDHYPTMKKWINYMQQFVVDGIMTRDTYGDWCVPPEDLNLIHTNDPARTTNAELIGTAYFFHELNLMTRFAGLLNKPEESEKFRVLAQQLKNAFNKKFLNTNPVSYSNNSQTASILPLAFGLVPDMYRQKIFDNLVMKIMGESEGHVGTGLIGCQWLMRVLTNEGRPDVAYTLATQSTYPSWGYMVEQGATTIWELWNGDKGDPGMNSHNHVMLLGDLIIWFYENLAGIKTDPGKPAFSHLIMRPEVFEDLRFIESTYQSINGPVKSAWKTENKKFNWQISIPVNTTATVYIPAENEKQVKESNQPAATAEGVKFLHLENDRAVYEIKSGTYAFSSEMSPFRTFTPYISTPVISPRDTIVTIPDHFYAKIECKTPEVEIRYTLDGREVDATAPVYSGPIPISKSSLLRSKAFKKGFNQSIEKSVFYDFIDTEKNGMSWRLYKGAYTAIPDFSNLNPSKTGRASRVSLDRLEIPEQEFAMLFTGQIEIITGGEYIFYTSSNDGSQLYINDKLIVDNDGEHGAKEMSGKIRLEPGRHRIEVSYFQSGGSKFLAAYYQGPDLKRNIIPGSVLYFGPDAVEN